jgi:uncharacterized membrane protein YqiK
MCQSVRKRLAAALVAVLLLAGCGATIPRFNAELIKPDSRGAVVYVYRPHTVIGIANADVSILHLDGQRMARIRIGGYLAIPVSPGQHRLSTTQSLLFVDTGRVVAEANFAAPADSTVYVRYTETFKTFTPIVLPRGGAAVSSSCDCRLESVPEAEAQADLAKLTALELDSK